MALTKYKLGDLIAQRREKYDEVEELPIRGVSREGFIPPKQEDADLSMYNVFYRNDFVFNPARMELNSIALNVLFDKAICSSLYEIFYVKREDLVVPEYLNLFIKRDEFARKCWFEAIGSARNYFRVPALAEFDIELPDLPTQQKYVDIYKAMVANQQGYERGLEDLKLVCDGYIEDLRRNHPCEKIGGYIRVGEKNKDEKVSNVLGIGQAGFIKPQKKPNESLKNYKILKPKMIAYAPPLYNMLTGAIHYYDGEELAVCSPIYEVFECRDKLLPDYLILWLKREEFKRYAAFFAAGVRGTFDYEFMEDVEIPIPDIQVQKAIAGMYSVYVQRKEINEKLKAQIKDICPILIKGSLEEGK